MDSHCGPRYSFVSHLFIFFLLIFQLFGNISINAVPESIQSLELKFQNETDELKKIDIANEILWKCRYTKPEIGIKYGKMALVLEKKLTANLKMARTLNLTGICYTSLKQYKKALQHHLKSKEIAERFNSPYQLARAYNNIANIYKLLSQYDKAFSHLYQAVNLFTQTDNQSGLSYSLIILGDLEISLKRFEKGLEYYERAYRIQVKIGDLLEQHRIYLRKADVQFRKGKYQKSLDMYRQMKKALERSDLNYRDPSVIPYHLAVALSGIGNNHFRLSQNRKALAVYFRALEINNRINAYINAIKNHNDIGKTFMAIGDYQLSLNHLQKGSNLASRYGLINRQVECMASLTDLYKLQSNYEKALQSFEKTILLRETIFNEQKNQQIEALRMDYEVQGKEQQITYLKNRAQLKNLQKNSLFLFLLLGFIMIAVSFLRFIQKVKLHKKLQSQKQLLEQAYADLQTLNKKAISLERKNTALAMAVTANHEIKQPLTILLGNFDLLTSQIELSTLNQKAQNHIVKIRKSISKMTEILDKYKETEEFTIEDYDKDKKILIFKEE